MLAILSACVSVMIFSVTLITALALCGKKKEGGKQGIRLRRLLSIVAGVKADIV